jgi:hypothetical protein
MSKGQKVNMVAKECDAAHSGAPPNPPSRILNPSLPIAIHPKRRQSNLSPAASPPAACSIRAFAAPADVLTPPAVPAVPAAGRFRRGSEITRPIRVQTSATAATAAAATVKRSLWIAAAIWPTGRASRPPLSRTKSGSNNITSTSSTKMMVRRSRRPRRTVRFAHRISKRECHPSPATLEEEKRLTTTATQRRRQLARGAGAPARAARGALLGLLGLLLWARHGRRSGCAVDEGQGVRLAAGLNTRGADARGWRLTRWF